MPVADWIDQLLPNFLTLGRGTSAIALKTSPNLVEVRDTADSAYRDLRARDVRVANLHLDSYQILSRVPVGGRRQCVLAGRINTSTGQPNAMITVGGLNCQLEASATTPLVYSFAAGFDTTGGPIDFVGVQAANQGFSGLTANATNYFYADRNVSTGAITFARITLPPIYSRTAPASPATGQHWFNTAPTINTSGQTGMTMYEWSGSAWVARQRVFVAEVVTNASASISAVTYAYQRRYQSVWTAFTIGQTINFAHNLGMTMGEGEAHMTFYGRTSSSDPNMTAIPYASYYGNDVYGVRPFAPTGARLNQVLDIGNAGAFFAGGWIASGELQVIINSGW